jgi:hypothetical protein
MPFVTTSLKAPPPFFFAVIPTDLQGDRQSISQFARTTHALVPHLV